MIGQLLVLFGAVLVIPSLDVPAERQVYYMQLCACVALALGIIALNIPTDKGTF